MEIPVEKTSEFLMANFRSAIVGVEQHYFFPPFHLDRVNAQLWRGEEKISLRRKTFDVLLYLVDHACGQSLKIFGRALENARQERAPF
jgi:hypothetical protein